MSTMITCISGLGIGLTASASYREAAVADATDMSLLVDRYQASISGLTRGGGSSDCRAYPVDLLSSHMLAVECGSGFAECAQDFV